MRIGRFLTSGSALLVLAATIPAGAATIAQYNFDSFSSGNTVVTDISGNGHDVTFAAGTQSLSSDNPFGQSGNNSLTVSQANVGNAANGNTVNLNSGGNQFTFEGWLKPAAYTTTYLVYMDGSDGGNSVQLYLAMGSDGKAYTKVYDGGGNYIASPDNLVLNSWNYLAGVYDGNTLHLYLKNGNHPTLTEVNSISLGKALPTSINGAFQIVQSSDTASVKYDDIRISNTALSDAELGYHASFTPVPEPAALSLLSLGALAMIRRRRA